MNGEKRAEIYTHRFDDYVYAMNWSVRRDKRFRLAVGSFKEDPSNTVQIIQLDDEAGKFVAPEHHKFDHSYPATKLMFIPDKDGTKPDLMATTGDCLRLWSIHDDRVSMELLLTHPKAEFCAPLTSFDWNEIDPKRLATASIDTTCTIWDIEKGVVDTQLIAHDKEVYDIAWGGLGVFATVSADGSLRVFDLRDKEHSTIIFESPGAAMPLLRIGWNKQDPRYMAAVTQESARVVVLDIRYPTVPMTELQRHQQAVNALCWAPHSSSHICTAGDDCQALIWDLSGMSSGQPDSTLDPILAYNAGSEVTQLHWGVTQPDWVAICFEDRCQILRV